MKTLTKKTVEIFYTFYIGKTSSLSFELGENPLFSSEVECKEYLNKHNFNLSHATVIKVSLSKV